MNSERSAPTWRNAAQLNWISELSRSQTDALEIGTFGGAGAQALLNGVSGLVFSIEPLGYSPENDEEQEVSHEDLPFWIRKLAKANPDRFIPIAGRSEHQIWYRPIGVLVIDGDHSFNGVFRDSVQYATHVVDQGIVFIDAYGHPTKPGVKPAWDVFSQKKTLQSPPGSWEHLGNVRYLNAWKRHLAG